MSLVKVCSKCGDKFPMNDEYFGSFHGIFNNNCKSCEYMMSIRIEYRTTNSNDIIYYGENTIKKICSKCKKELPANTDYFARNNASRDSLLSSCRYCNRKQQPQCKENHKICKKCKQELPNTLEYFKVNLSCIDLKSNICIQCDNEYRKNRSQNNKIKNQNKQYDENILAICIDCNKEFPFTPDYFKIQRKTDIGLEKLCLGCKTLRNKNYYQKHKQERIDYMRQYKKDNRDIVLERKRNFYKNNKQKIDNGKKEYYISKIKYNSDAFQKLIKYEEYRVNPNDNELGQIKCTYCKQWVTPTVSEVYERLRAINGYGSEGQESRIYCNEYCKLSCPIYKKINIESIGDKNTSREVIPLLRYLVLERDNYQCQMCAATTNDTEIHVHHIISYTQNKMLGNDPENCITLCKFHHNQVHQQEGCSYYDLRCK